jgi:hypothetical protein
MPPSSRLNPTLIAAAACFLIGGIILWRTFVAPPPNAAALNPPVRATLILPPLPRMTPASTIQAGTPAAAMLTPEAPAPLPYPPPTEGVAASPPTITPQVAAAAPPVPTIPPATAAPAVAPTTGAYPQPTRESPPVPDTPVPAPTQTDGTIQITFRVEGSTTDVAIYYYVNEEETILSQSDLPWVLVFTVTPGTTLELVGENLAESGDIRCAIEVTSLGAAIDSDSNSEPEGLAECIAVIE